MHAISSQESHLCMNRQCIFCTVAEGGSDVGIVVQDQQTLTLLDVGQFRSGHLLIAPRMHVGHSHDMEDAAIEAVILAVKRAVLVVDLEFPGDGVSVWPSTSHPSLPEMAHVHFHVHPKHAVAEDMPTAISPTSVAERLRRRMLETYSTAIDLPMTRSSWQDTRGDMHVSRSHTYLWCGCSERPKE